MKLRLSGTDAECRAAVAALAAGFTIREVSGFYPNRGESVLGRVYVDVEPLTAAAARPGGGRVRATATQVDPARREIPAGPGAAIENASAPSTHHRGGAR